MPSLSTGRLLKLAAHRAANPADFHFVSTLSVCGKAPESGFRLFTEYDSAPEMPDENYYIRGKQEAERLVVAARETLANACIHRVGNLVFAAEGARFRSTSGKTHSSGNWPPSWRSAWRPTIRISGSAMWMWWRAVWCYWRARPISPTKPIIWKMPEGIRSPAS
jgi:hypothetical protein